MKNKFLLLILSLLLLSACTLSAGMYAVEEISEEPKDYEFSEQSFDFVTKEPDAPIDIPTSQDTLKEKFQSMYEIDEETNTITVVSRSYLKEYWKSNYEKETIRSLTLDEVMYIVQDSVNIYTKYDKIILPEFICESENADAEFKRRFPNTNKYAPISDEAEVYERFPYFEREIHINPFKGYNLYGMFLTADCRSIDDRMIQDIFALICYRIEVLSSPKAFIQGAEFMHCVDISPYSNPEFSRQTYYYPGLTQKSQREEILKTFKKNFSSNTYGGGYPVTIKFIGNFFSWHYGSGYIDIAADSKNSVQTLEHLFPTKEIKETVSDFLAKTTYKTYVTNSVNNENFGAWFLLNQANRTVVIGKSSEDGKVFKGRYEENENEIVFQLRDGDDDEILIGKAVFELVEGKYVFSHEKSNPNIATILSLTDKDIFEFAPDGVNESKPIVDYIVKGFYYIYDDIN